MNYVESDGWELRDSYENIKTVYKNNLKLCSYKNDGARKLQWEVESEDARKMVYQFLKRAEDFKLQEEKRFKDIKEKEILKALGIYNFKSKRFLLQH